MLQACPKLQFLDSFLDFICDVPIRKNISLPPFGGSHSLRSEEAASLARREKDPSPERVDTFDPSGTKRSNASLKLNPIPASIPLIHLPLLYRFCIIKGCG